MMWIGENSEKALPPPAILKPKPLWTGKQLMSMIIPNVNLLKFFDANDKKGERDWCPTKENIVYIQRGQILMGFLNKATAGTSS